MFDKPWSEQVFLFWYGCIGLGLSAWCLTQIIYFFVVQAYIPTTTSLVSLFAIMLIGWLVIIAKYKQGTLQKQYTKDREKFRLGRHRYLILQSLIYGMLLLLVSYIASVSMGHHLKVTWLGIMMSYVLIVGVIYCWQLWAVICCDKFFVSMNSQ